MDKCMACGGSMEVGFVLAHRYQEWWEGAPPRSLWARIKKPERRYRVLTCRCTKCGYLMDFANPDKSQ